MAETDQEAPRFRLIGPEDLGRFHRAKGVENLKCWVCGTSSWFIQSDAESVANYLPWIASDATESEKRFLTLILSCAHCGTLWNIDYQAVLKWLTENPE